MLDRVGGAGAFRSRAKAGTVGLSGGTSMVIAEAVKAVLDTLVF